MRCQKKIKKNFEKFLAGIAGSQDDLTIGWLPKDVIGDMKTPPLFKNLPANIEKIDLSELINRLHRAVNAIQGKYKKGRYWITQIRGSQGIYIWDGPI